METNRKKPWQTPEVSRLSVKSLTLTKAATHQVETPGSKKDGDAWGKGGS